MKEKRKNMTAIVKAVGNNCNLKCGYCFYRELDQQEETLMPLDLLEEVVRQYMDIEKTDCRFIWHGGEPLLAGIDYYQIIIELQKKYRRRGQSVRNSFQTNATLVTEQWARFIKENNFGVGVSLDGCRKSHNRFRSYQNGDGSFDDTMNGIKLLQRQGIKPGFIQTVTRSHLGDVSENFDFFVKELGAKSWGINYFHGDCHCAHGQMADQSVEPWEMADHLKKCIELWLGYDDDGLLIREIENYFRPAMGGFPSNCDFSGGCRHFFCVNFDGRVFHCDRFSHSSDYCIGSLKNDSLLDILLSKRSSALHESVVNLPSECSLCRWVSYCQNGCPHHRTEGISGKYVFCEARKMLFEYAEKVTADFGL